MDFFSEEGRLTEVSEYLRDLRAQDDRSCVIVISARFEFLLRQAIEQRLLERRSKRKDGIARLSFAGCISWCFRLGVIHRTHADALDALRKIRNAAAHFDKPMALTDAEYQESIKLFSAPWSADRPRSHFHEVYRKELTRSASGERALFVVTASIFFVFFSPLAFITERISPSPVVRGLPSFD